MIQVMTILVRWLIANHFMQGYSLAFTTLHLSNAYKSADRIMLLFFPIVDLARI